MDEKRKTKKRSTRGTEFSLRRMSLRLGAYWMGEKRWWTVARLGQWAHLLDAEVMIIRLREIMEMIYDEREREALESDLCEEMLLLLDVL